MINKTDVTVILDRSGSMNSIKNDMEGGFNSFIEAQKKLTTDQTVISLIKFNGFVQNEYEGLALDKVPKLNLEPNGSTALHDAVGKTVNAIGTRLSNLKEQERPNKVVVLIITDGEENASKEFNGNQIRDMVKHQTEVYNWEFVFLGANLNAINTAKSIGIAAHNSMTYAANSIGTESAFASFSTNMISYRGNVTGCANMNFSDTQRSVQTRAGVAEKFNVTK